MCKILVRGVAPVRKAKDDFEDAVLFKPGDLLEAVPDDHVFGAGEVPPLFFVISVPGMTVEEGNALCSPMKQETDIRGNPDWTKPLALGRALRIDVADFKATMTRAEIMAAIKTKTKPPSPFVIGDIG